MCLCAAARHGTTSSGKCLCVAPHKHSAIDDRHRREHLRGGYALSCALKCSQPKVCVRYCLQKQRAKGAGKHGCKHYRRRCKLVSPCCGEVFWCRHCHNDVKAANEWVSPRASSPQNPLLMYAPHAAFASGQRGTRHCRVFITGHGYQKGWYPQDTLHQRSSDWRMKSTPLLNCRTPTSAMSWTGRG